MSAPLEIVTTLDLAIRAFADATEPGDTAAVFLPDGGTWLLFRQHDAIAARPATDDEIYLALAPAESV